VVFADAKHIETNLVSERDCFEQLAEMSRGINGPTGRVNGCRYETIYANLHQWPLESPRGSFRQRPPTLFSPAASSTRGPTR
jgi:hypothetical protein